MIKSLNNSEGKQKRSGGQKREENTKETKKSQKQLQNMLSFSHLHLNAHKNFIHNSVGGNSQLYTNRKGENKLWYIHKIEYYLTEKKQNSNSCLS
jgi:hypothetical protein